MSKVSYLTKALKMTHYRPHTSKEREFEEMFKKALEKISQEYRPGTIGYIKASCPQLWKRILSAEDKLTEAWLTGEVQNFNRALDELLELDGQANKIYRNRGNNDSLLDLT